MAKTLAQIQADPKYKYTDKAGKVRDRTLNIPHYFKEIPFIYSPLLEKGRVKFSATMQKLYCYVADWEKSGGVCYEEQSELAKVCDLSRGKTNDLIEQMELIGLITTTKIPGRRNLELRALSLTDAHIIPPDQLSAAPESDVVRQQPEPMPAPEPATAEELNAPDLDAIPFACDEPEEQPTPTIPTQQDKPELPWGGTVPGKTNGQPQDAAMEWALTKTKGDEEEAYRLISRVASEYFGREVLFEPHAEEDSDDIEF